MPAQTDIGPAAAPLLAVAFMVMATVFIAATTLMAKALGTEVLGPSLPPFMVSFGRYLFGALTFFAVAAVLRPRLTTAHLPLHLGRIACGWAGVTLMFAAVATIPLAEATAITFLNPIFAMMLAIPVLGEKVGRWRWLAAAIALGGAGLLLRPGTGAIAPGALLALAAAVILGCEVMFIKRLTRREPLMATLVWANGLGLVISGLSVVTIWQAPTAAQWGAMAALGVTMAAAQGCFVNALARAEASFVTPFSYLTLVFAGLYDAMLFGVIPDAVGWLGTGLIVTGAALLAWREGRRSSPPVLPTVPPLPPPSHSH
ncbi:DMT family transporter [Jannaschia sp. M317]|uniref:DMT family transporter n=1 Tax=Jannaschia sp. M317 TaxID=2867011 RepID=UPI0021A8C298|nr:DMT family transporter [Jannaschia sp. M317]UWQ17602.1 DMT family transporter [Jannaschia sp. M317]